MGLLLLWAEMAHDTRFDEPGAHVAAATTPINRDFYFPCACRREARARHSHVEGARSLFRLERPKRSAVEPYEPERI